MAQGEVSTWNPAVSLNENGFVVLLSAETCTCACVRCFGVWLRKLRAESSNEFCFGSSMPVFRPQSWNPDVVIHMSPSLPHPFYVTPKQFVEGWRVALHWPHSVWGTWPRVLVIGSREPSDATLQLKRTPILFFTLFCEASPNTVYAGVLVSVFARNESFSLCIGKLLKEGSRRHSARENSSGILSESEDSRPIRHFFMRSVSGRNIAKVNKASCFCLWRNLLFSFQIGKNPFCSVGLLSS